MNPVDMNPVDLALILAFDGSASVGFDEFGLTAGGCAAALRDAEIVAGLVGGPSHASLLALLLWSGNDAQAVLIGWTRLASAADCAGFAAAVEGISRPVQPGTTAIGAALLACEALFAAQPSTARRQVIDVAGDGRSNDGPPPAAIRDRLVARGVTINGLCVLHEEPDLLASYAAEVVGGTSGFALRCQDYTGFADAMRQKLQQEVAALSPAADAPVS